MDRKSIEKQPSSETTRKKSEVLGVPLEEARDALSDGLLVHLNSVKACGDTISPGDLADGMLISVLKLIALNGKCPIDKGRFWQILDQYGPFAGSELGEAIRADLASEIEGLFAAAAGEEFKDGFDSALSLKLQRLIVQFDDTTLAIVSDLILGNRVEPEVAAEALRCIGAMENGATHPARRALLEQSLACPSHITRDGAVVGLSHLRDPSTIPSLEAAATKEEYRLLQANMVQLLQQLRELQT
jgi:hypothetical protein